MKAIKKKTYTTPTIEIIMIQQEACLLEESLDVKNSNEGEDPDNFDYDFAW